MEINYTVYIRTDVRWWVVFRIQPAWPSFLIVVPLSCPATPNAENSHHNDHAENPLNPISTEKSLVCAIFHKFIIVRPFPFIGLSASFFSCNCQIDTYMIFFILVNQSTMSGLRHVRNYMSWNFRFFSNSTARCQF